MVINYDHVSIIMRNVPYENDDITGRIRDNIALLCEAAEVRVQAIQVELAEKKKKLLLENTFNKLNSILNLMVIAQKESKNETENAINKMAEKLENLFVGLGLTDHQEDTLMALMALMHETVSEISEAQNHTDIAQSGMEDVISSLQNFSDSAIT